MNKSSHFAGQPVYGQLINLLDKSKILQISREKGGEKYVKRFDAWQHMLIMLYAVIKRFDSLREITDSMFPEAGKFAHLGIEMMPQRSTLFSNLLFKGVGRHPKTGKKKGGIKPTPTSMQTRVSRLMSVSLPRPPMTVLCSSRLTTLKAIFRP